MSIFDTKLNRGRFLVVVFVLLLIGTRLLVGWGAGAADKEAARRAAGMRAALDGRTAGDFPIALTPDQLADLPGGPYDFVAPGPDGGITAGVEIHRGLQSRCVRVDLATEGAISVRTAKRGC